MITRITITGEIGGYIQQNVLHFDFPTGTGLDLLDATAEIRDNWINLVRVAQASDFRYTSIVARNMDDITQPPQTEIISVHGAGGTVLNWWGPMSIVFSIRTLFFGRKGRGRFYVGGFYVGIVGQGQFTADAQIFNQGIANDLKGRYIDVDTAGPLRLGVAPRIGSADNFKSAIQLIAQPTPGVQRRRNFGVGA